MNRKTLFVFLFFFAAIYLLPALFRPMISPDEFRYAEIPREMCVSGDWTVPRLLNVRYFEKTPLNYWCTAVCFRIFGENKFALRLTPVLATLFTALLLVFWLRRSKASEREQQVAPLLYLSGALVIGLGNILTTDALLTLGTTAAMAGFHLAADEQSFRKRLPFLLGAGAALAAGFLTKGLIAFAVPALAITAYLIWQRKWLDFVILPWIPLLTAAALIAPWAWKIHQLEPDFWNYFIVYEHFQRFSDSAAGQHESPWWYLFPFFLLGLFPAGLPLLSAWSKSGFRELFNRPVMRFSAGAVAVILIFFSLSDGKLATYILPAFAPAALAGSLWFCAVEKEKAVLRRLQILRKGTGIVWITAGILTLLAAIFYLLFCPGHLPKLPLEVAVWTPLITAAAAGAVIAGVLTLRSKSSLPDFERFFLSIAVTGFAAAWFFPVFTANSKMPEQELLEISRQLKERGEKDFVIVSWPGMMQAVAWCFRDAQVQLLDGISEMEYGNNARIKEGKPSITRTKDEWRKYLNSPQRKRSVIFITYAEDIVKLQQKLNAGSVLITGGEIGACYAPVNIQGEKTR